MNTSELNGFDLNGPSTEGHNALLSGGLVAAWVLSASLMNGVILTGGITSAGDAAGRVASTLRGGVKSGQVMGGQGKLTINLQGGIENMGQVDSFHMGVEPSLRGGIESPITVGGQAYTHIRLQSEDQVGQDSLVGAGYIFGRSLQDGVTQTAYVGGGLTGGTVLASDGVKSTSKIDSSVMKLGITLSGGLTGVSGFGGGLKNNVILSGGFLALSEIGKELDIEALLQGPVYNTHTVGGDWKIDWVGNEGFASSFIFDADQKISPTANGGFGQGQQLQAKLKTTARLQGGISKVAYIGGKGITASQVLRGGVFSATNNGTSGQLIANALLQGPIESSAVVHGDIVQGFRDPLLNTWALEIRSATIPLTVVHPTSDT